MTYIYDFFASVGPGWTNLATVVGAILGIAISGYAIWFSKKLSDDSNMIADSIRANTDAIQKQTLAIHTQTKILRLDNLRNLYELSRGDSQKHRYWHFRWRFETYDTLGVQIHIKNNNEYETMGYCDLQIQEFSVLAGHLGFEHRESEFYTAKIANFEAAEGHRAPFQNGEIIACFEQNGDLIISKGIDPYTLEPKFHFNVVRLGPYQSGSGERTVGTLPTFPRIKDS